MRKIILIIMLIAGISLMKAQAPTDTFPKQRIRATFYSDKFEGRKTSSGEVFRQNNYTAAHKSMKFGTLVLVTNLNTGSQVIVKVNDRCPKAGLIDLSKRAALQIGINSQMVDIQILPEEYRYFWENQEKYLPSLKEGTFLSAANALQNMGSDPLPAPTTLPAPTVGKPLPQKASATAGKPAPKATPAPLPTKPLQPLFDLEICIVSHGSEPSSVIERLPIHYRNKAYLHSVHNELYIRLSLSMTQEEIKEVQRDLYTLFPRSKPVCISDPKNQ